MAKLFSEKLNNLEKTINKIEDLDKRLTDCENRLSGFESRFCIDETKINQLIDEITPILIHHAEALKKLMSINNGCRNDDSLK